MCWYSFTTLRICIKYLFNLIKTLNNLMRIINIIFPSIYLKFFVNKTKTFITLMFSFLLTWLLLQCNHCDLVKRSFNTIFYLDLQEYKCKIDEGNQRRFRGRPRPVLGPARRRRSSITQFTASQL